MATPELLGEGRGVGEEEEDGAGSRVLGESMNKGCGCVAGVERGVGALMIDARVTR